AMREIATGCESDKIEVLVCAAAVTIQAPVSVCAGDPITLSETAGHAISWNWTGPNGFNGTSQTVIDGNTANPGNRNYTVVISDILGCPNTRSATVVVNPLPQAFNIVGETLFCEPLDPGAPVRLSGSQTGVNYQLYRNGIPTGAPLPGTGAVLEFGIQPAGTYTVIATHVAQGCSRLMNGAHLVQGMTCTITIADPCSCKNNATNLLNGQFDERIKITAPSWQNWTVKSVSGLYQQSSPAPPAAPVSVQNGMAFQGIGGNMFDLPGVLVDAIGYTITATNGFTDLNIPLRACYYPDPTLLDVGGPYCLNSPPITLAATVLNNPVATNAHFSVNGLSLPAAFNPAAGQWEATYDITTLGVYQVYFQFDAGAPVANDPTDPGCIQRTASQFFNVVATPSALNCNNLVTVSLDAACQLSLLPDMVLEGSYACFDDYSVELDKTAPLGNGPWLPPVLDISDIGKTYVYRVLHLPSGNLCWGNLKIEDKLPPTLQCEPFTVPCNTPDFAPAYLANVLGIPAAQPVAIDCQPISWTYLDTEMAQGCATGLTKIIFRKWTATDASGNSTTCVQEISLLRPGLADVVAPPDYDGFDAQAFSCTDALPLVNGHPNPTPDWLEAQGLQGYPHVFGAPSGCSINWEWHDWPIEICDGTVKYRREWTIVDWCVGDGFVHNQILKVVDETGPEMECPANLTVSTDPFTCCATVNLPDVIVSDHCSRISQLSGMITLRDAETNQVINMLPVSGSLKDFAGNNHWTPDTLADFGWTSCLPAGNQLVTYLVEDDCGNTTTCQFQLTIRDYTPPVASCGETTTVAMGGDDTADCYTSADGCSFAGVTWVKAGVFNDGSYDACHPVKFSVRRMAPYTDCINQLSHDPCYPGGLSEFDLATAEMDSIKFYCCEVGTTQTVVLSVYQVDLNGNLINGPDGTPVKNECMVQVEVQDKTKPACQSPANVSVNCENFDPSLWTYGKAQILDNCCLDQTLEYQGQCGLTHSVNYTLFDTVCNKGTITRTFRAFDCSGNSSQCTQRVFVNYLQDYFVKFPNDAIVTTCDGTGNFGEPLFFGEDCELLGVSHTDEVFTVVPDACFKIERTWQIINWCTFNPNQPLIEVPNPNPNPVSNAAANLPGPTVSACGTIAPWAPTVVKINPTDLTATNYCTFWQQDANGYKYKQIIKVQDGQAPTGAYASPTCDNQNWTSGNHNQLWNEMYWWDNGIQTHDLCEEPTELSITGTDACSGANVNIEYLLFLDLDGDGTMETVVNSVNTGLAGLGWNNVLYGNLNTPNFSGGTPRAFDERLVPTNQKYGFAIQETVVGTNKTATVRWNTQQQQNNYVVPELPHGTHKIKWFITDGCGNNSEYEYTFTVRDCKAPTVVCLNGLSANIMPTGMIQLWASDFLQYTEDNCTPAGQIRIGIRKCGGGTGFPLDAQGNPITNVTFDCNELGTQCVELWAIDAAGNADYCESYIIVQDNLG
ncbi:MAG: hypothetical protein JNN28_20490, partial [Saprospiraceae bacterium]|nr:hypothetical protein [Saprospiraceae bacterium]